MSIAYTRKLDEPKLVEHFLRTVLQVENVTQNDIKELTKVENELAQLDIEKSTHNDKTKWHKPYNSPKSRADLRKLIADELYSKKRLSKDDLITFGSGGSKPKNLKNERKAYIIIGLPAAGKSGIANKVADLTGAYILDNDYAKRKIPEFHNSEIGATITHNESELIVFGLDSVRNFTNFTPLFFQCVQKGHNLVIPKIGAKQKSVTEIVDILTTNCGYEVHLILVNLNRQFATKRALGRYKDSRRYVPLSLIFDGYANDPTITYFRLQEIDVGFSSFGEIDTTLKPYKKTGKANSIIHKITF